MSYARGPVPEVEAMYAKMREDDQRVLEARKKLQSSDTFLAILERHLNSGWNINNDGSFDPSDALRDHSASRNRRKRPASDSDDELNFHQRHRGRMPPKPIEGSRSGLSSQTFSSRGGEGLFSVPSRMEISRGSPGPSSDDPRPSDEGSSAKQ